MEVEFALDRQQSALEGKGRGVTREFADMNLNNYHVNFVYNFGDDRDTLRPFIFGGLGATQAQPKDIMGSAIDSNTKFSSNWGGGLKAYPARNVGVKLMARWVPTFIKSEPAGIWCSPYWGFWLLPAPRRPVCKPAAARRRRHVSILIALRRTGTKEQSTMKATPNQRNRSGSRPGLWCPGENPRRWTRCHPGTRARPSSPSSSSWKESRRRAATTSYHLRSASPRSTTTVRFGASSRCTSSSSFALDAREVARARAIRSGRTKSRSPRCSRVMCKVHSRGGERADRST